MIDEQVWDQVFGVNTADAANAERYNPEELATQITAKSKTVSRVGFIGLGAMGFGMATYLVKSNFCVLGYDVSANHCLFHIMFFTWCLRLFCRLVFLNIWLEASWQ